MYLFEYFPHDLLKKQKNVLILIIEKKNNAFNYFLVAYLRLSVVQAQFFQTVLHLRF